jgi:uncharacterized protein (DUF2147 family)
MRLRIVSVILLLPSGLLPITLVTTSHAAGSSDPTGPWLTEDGSAVVHVASCAQALCATIVWSEKPVDARGEKLCGMAVLGGAVSSGPASWSNGWIYSAKANAKYRVELSLPGDSKFHLHIAAGLFGRDQVWTRPSQAFTPCTP